MGTITLPRFTFTTPSDREMRVERIWEAPLDRVWQAFSDPAVLVRWWARGNKADLERFEFEKGGRWRIVEHADDGSYGFEGKFREIVPKQRIAQTFEFDGAPGYVSVDAIEFQDLGDGRTKTVSTSIFHTAEELKAMIDYGCEEGIKASYAALDRLLAEG